MLVMGGNRRKKCRTASKILRLFDVFWTTICWVVIVYRGQTARRGLTTECTPRLCVLEWSVVPLTFFLSSRIMKYCQKYVLRAVWALDRLKLRGSHEAILVFRCLSSRTHYFARVFYLEHRPISIPKIRCGYANDNLRCVGLHTARLKNILTSDDEYVFPLESCFFSSRDGVTTYSRQCVKWFWISVFLCRRYMLLNHSIIHYSSFCQKDRNKFISKDFFIVN